QRLHHLPLLCHIALIGPETTAPRTRSTAGEIASPPQRGCRAGAPVLARPVGDSRRSLDLCRPAAISGAFEAISRLTRATRRSLSFACAVVSGPGRVVEVTK